MHLIQKQHIEVRAATQQQALAAQTVIEQLYWQRLVPALDALFSRIAPEKGTLIQLDRLELDLGTIPLQEIERKVLEAVEEQLRMVQYNLTSSNLSKTARIQKIDTPTSKLNALLLFLEYGLFPWWYNSKNSTAKPIALLEEIIDEQVENLLAALKQNRRKTQIQARLSKQFPLECILKIVAQQEKTVSDFIQEVLKLLKNLPDFSAHKNIIQGIISKEIAALLTSSTKIDKTAFLRKVIQPIVAIDSIANFADTILKKLVDFLSQKEVSISTFQLSIAALKQFQKNTSLPIETINELSKALDLPIQQLKELSTTDKIFITIKPLRPSNEDVSNDKISNSTKPPTPKVKDESKPTIKEIQTALAEGIYIEQAGWVLIAPFLPTYFERLGLLDSKKQFKDEEAQHSAPLLLHYLATGETEASEEQLLLHKIVVGLDWETPLERTLELSPTIIAQSTDLLNSVIEHWAALGNSSVEAIRETFFWREGRLQQQDKHWQLLIERKTVDILLERLPWSFHQIHLPWMNTRLSVGW